MSMSFLVILLQLVVGGKDAVDLLDTQTYWAQYGQTLSVQALIPLTAEPQTAAVDAALAALLAAETDAEARAAAERLLALGEPARPAVMRLRLHERDVIRTVADLVLQAMDQARDGRPPIHPLLHRLLAIKTLGELGDPAAKPTLEALTHSDAPFVAEYAQRALLAIAGERAPPINPAPSRLAGHLAALPADSNIVGHLAPIPGSEPAVVRRGGMQINVGGLNLTGGDTTRQTPQLATLLGQIGNLRTRGALVGLNLQDDHISRATLIIEGDIDPLLILASFALAVRDAAVLHIRHGRPVLVLPGAHAVVSCHGADTLLVVYLRDADADALLAAADALITRLLQPPAEPPLRDLLAGVDRSGPIWGAARFPPGHDWGADWDAFDGVILSTQAAAGVCTCHLRARGHGRPALEAFATEMNRTLTDVRAEWQDGIGGLPLGRPITQLLDSITLELTADDTVDARVELNPAVVAMLPVLTLLIDSGDATDAEADADPAAPR